MINAGLIPAPDLNTYYAIHFAPGITIDDGSGALSCQIFCAYHGTLRNPTSNSASVPYIYYGIMPDMGGGCASGCGSSTTFNNLCSVSSHELAEMITDPAVGLAFSLAAPLAWYDNTNGEVADICNGQQGTTIGSDGATYFIQKQWSNKAGVCLANAQGVSPTKKPTRRPTKKPSPRRPTSKPSLRKPTKKPTKFVSKKPTKFVSKKPTKRVTKSPTKRYAATVFNSNTSSFSVI